MFISYDHLFQEPRPSEFVGVLAVIIAPAESVVMSQCTNGYVTGNLMRRPAYLPPGDVSSDGDWPLNVSGRVIRFGVSGSLGQTDSASALIRSMNMSGAMDIWAAPCNVLIIGTGERRNVRVPVVHRETVIASTISEARARWTFLYRKFGNFNRYIELIVGVYIDILIPENVTILDEEDVDVSEPILFGTVEIVFTEINDTEAATVEVPLEGEYEPGLGVVFDALFVRPDEDAVRRIAALAVVGIFATVWAYTVFFFDD
jgi:hypothetical protein